MARDALVDARSGALVSFAPAGRRSSTVSPTVPVGCARPDRNLAPGCRHSQAKPSSKDGGFRLLKGAAEGRARIAGAMSYALHSRARSVCPASDVSPDDNRDAVRPLPIADPSVYVDPAASVSEEELDGPGEAALLRRRNELANRARAAHQFLLATRNMPLERRLSSCQDIRRSLEEARRSYEGVAGDRACAHAREDCPRRRPASPPHVYRASASSRSTGDLAQARGGSSGDPDLGDDDPPGEPARRSADDHVGLDLLRARAIA